MELVGKVILDNETMESLKSEIRREVIEDIKKSGNYSSEIEKYMNDCDYKSYIRMIRNTIDNIIEKTNENDIDDFGPNHANWKILLAIQNMLQIKFRK